MTKSDEYWRSLFEQGTDLDPVDMLSEVLFGLIMVLTFTCTISASTAGRSEVSEFLWAALGCNFAWGLVDALMNLMNSLIERGHEINLIRKIRESGSANASREMIRGNIMPLFSELMEDNEIDKLGVKLKKLPAPALKVFLTSKDIVIAGKIFFLVFLSTFPVALPFLIIKDVAIAMRVSNGVALILMFTAGYFLGRYSGLKPIKISLAFTALGILFVSLTMFLGG